MIDDGNLAALAAAATMLVLVFKLLRESIELDTLLWWPILLYIPGPSAIYVLFSDHAIFQSYFSQASILWATLGFVIGIGLYFAVLSNKANSLLQHNLETLRDSTLSTGSLVPLYALGCICVVVQILLMAKTGASLASGAYVLGDGAFKENSALFTFSAGLYEIFAALSGFRLFSALPLKSRDKRYLFFVVVVLAARMFGGTRLIILKLVVFSMILSYVLGFIKRRTVLVAGATFAVLLMLVGSIRSGESEDAQQLVFLLLAEPALGSLSATFVTDYAISKGDWLNPYFVLDALGYVIFIVIHLLPTAIYSAFGGTITYLGDWGYYRTAAEAFYPFGPIIAETGVETVSPVGGQSLIALGVALFGVAGAALMVPSLIGALMLLARLFSGVAPVLLIVAFEAPSIFRDSTEIFVKQVFVISVGYWIFNLLARMKVPAPAAFMPAMSRGSTRPRPDAPQQ